MSAAFGVLQAVAFALGLQDLANHVQRREVEAAFMKRLKILGTVWLLAACLALPA